MMLYGYKRTSKGRVRSEFPLGSIEWNGQPVVNVRDRNLRDNLRNYFTVPLWVPVPLGDEHMMMGHTWEELKPGTEEHFLEAVKRLHSQDMYCDLDS